MATKTETGLTSTAEHETAEIEQCNYNLNQFIAEPELQAVPRLHDFIAITGKIVSTFSAPETTTRIKINDEIRAQVQQILLHIPFEYPKIDWNTLQGNVSQYLPAILHSTYPNVISLSNVDQFAFGIKDAIRRAVLATPRKQTLCPYANRWWNDDIRILNKHAKRLRNIYRRSRNEYDKIVWREKANEYCNAIRIAKEETWRQFITFSSPSTDSRHDPSNPLTDRQRLAEIDFSTVYYELDAYVSTATFIAKLEALIH